MGFNVSLRLYFQRLVRSKNDTPNNLGVNDDIRTSSDEIDSCGPEKVPSDRRGRPSREQPREVKPLAKRIGHNVRGCQEAPKRVGEPSLTLQTQGRSDT